VTFRLEDVVPWGRSFDEYVAMFALTERDLGRRILDCGGGPASFNAVAAGRRMDVTTIDPIYAFGPDEIAQRIDATATRIGDELRENSREFVWTHFEHDVDFHVASILDLVRTAGEVRVLPLLELGSTRSRHLDRVIEELRERGLSAAVAPVPYEFQRGGNEMLVIE
jgi:hypothetical protein